jgi:hypothetical protein
MAVVEFGLKKYLGRPSMHQQDSRISIVLVEAYAIQRDVTKRLI